MAKVEKEEYDRQVNDLYSLIGRITVKAEHLNFAMNDGCMWLLQCKGLPQEYGRTVLAGYNIESMRRLWTPLLKQHYQQDADALKIVDKISTMVDNVNGRRNEIIHRIWYIGWGNDETADYSVAEGHAIKRDHKNGGVIVSSRDTKDFSDVEAALDAATELVRRLTGCILIASHDPSRGRPSNNFHYSGNTLLPGDGS